MDRLQKQLKNPDTKKDAADCIKLYNWLKDNHPDDGSFWDVIWDGMTPIYKPNITGYTLLKGIELG